MIFNLYKSKPTLKELIPNGFIDIHSHILPGIDDGAKDNKESLKIIDGLRKFNFDKIITTPHIYKNLYENNINTIRKSFNKLKLNDQKFHIGAEYMISFDMISEIENNNIITLADTKYVLIEMSYMNGHDEIFDIIFRLKSKNYKPILAHPERYLYYFNNIRELKKIKHFGCYFQINLFSLVGLYGAKVSKFCDKLIDENLIDFVGSDIHNESQLRNFHNKVVTKKLKKLEGIINNNIISFSK